MNDVSSGVWFIYDGDCPICNYAAHAFRIKQKYGDLHLINKREVSDHPLLLEINRRRLDLDKGMVIVADGNFYHGKKALRFMAQCGDDKGWFNRINNALFWSDTLSTLLYPWMRGTRNLLIFLRGKGKINNLR